ncbi:two-component regulator propeller domain-containing protein [Phenylobacterium sp.]|uniref:sensor histidine kinase n=1 Tax=Phenylobacterium sp. TaxID=1871053 RepID=UPI0035B481E4
MTGLARLALALALAAGICGAAAAGPLGDFKHVRWAYGEGAPSRINAITQTTDGYLWIGGVEGLFRFDGVIFEPVGERPKGAGRLVVSALLGARDGALWVGLARGGGVAVYRNGRLADAGLPNPSRQVNDLAQDGAGGLWVARGGRTSNTLARYWRGRWREFGPASGLPAQEVWRLLAARDGALWAALSDRVMVLRPGAERFEDVGVSTSPRASLSQDPRGRVWLTDATGVRLLSDSAKGRRFGLAARSPVGQVGGVWTIIGEAGDLWGATWNEGVFRLADPAAALADPGAGPASLQTYTAGDGLTSEQTRAVFQDREGNIWVGTELGLDMFRPASVIVEPGVPANSPTSYRMAAADDGVVYIADASALYAIRPGAAPSRVMRTGSPAQALCAGSDGAVWVALADRMLRIGDGHATETPTPPSTRALGCAQDGAGRLWMPALEQGLFRWEKGAWRRWPAEGGEAGLPANAAVDPSGKAAVVFRRRPPAPAGELFTPVFAERFGVGGVEGLAEGRDGLFVGGAKGLARLSNGQVRTLSAERYPWLASVNGLVQTPAGDTWTIGDAGIVRMSTEDLGRAFDSGGALPHRVFDFRDGLNSFVQKAPGAQVAVGGDGRVWFLTRRNVVRIDPARLAVNRLAPPVHIRAVSAGSRRFADPASAVLPAGATSVTIDYTAPSLSAPDRVRFRYRLQGVDRGWVEAGARRSALYAGLGPGRYRFQVTAMNNDGVWNPSGASVELRIPPTLLQSWWFRGALAALAALALWLGLRWRVRAETAAAVARLSERQAERVRIARELHDTLLQGFQGLLVRFQVVANAMAEGDPAKPMMDSVLDRADEILVEGRDRVRDLRTEEDSASPLTRQLERLAYELERDYAIPIDIRASGLAEPLNVDAHREILAIAREALTNACRHSRAQEIVCELTATGRKLVLECRDDGVGIDPALLRAGGRDGHWGLRGMEERTRQLGATLKIASAPGGTLVRLVVPMRVARLRPSKGRRRRFGGEA